MDAGYFARAGDVLKDTIGFEKDMFAVVDTYLFAADRIDERQFFETSVIEFRQGLEDLSEGRFGDEHRMKNAVCRIGFRVLAYTAAGERSVTYIHRIEHIVHRLFAIDREDHMLRFMPDECADESEEVIDRMGTDVVLEYIGFACTEGIDAETDGVDEIAMMLDVIAPIGDAAYVYRMPDALEETSEGLFMVLGE